MDLSTESRKSSFEKQTHDSPLASDLSATTPLSSSQSPLSPFCVPRLFSRQFLPPWFDAPLREATLSALPCCPRCCSCAQARPPVSPLSLRGTLSLTACAPRCGRGGAAVRLSSVTSSSRPSSGRPPRLPVPVRPSSLSSSSSSSLLSPSSLASPSSLSAASLASPSSFSAWLAFTPQAVSSGDRDASCLGPLETEDASATCSATRDGQPAASPRISGESSGRRVFSGFRSHSASRVSPAAFFCSPEQRGGRQTRKRKARKSGLTPFLRRMRLSIYRASSPPSLVPPPAPPLPPADSTHLSKNESRLAQHRRRTRTRLSLPALQSFASDTEECLTTPARSLDAGASWAPWPAAARATTARRASGGRGDPAAARGESGREGEKLKKAVADASAPGEEAREDAYEAAPPPRGSGACGCGCPRCGGGASPLVKDAGPLADCTGARSGGKQEKSVTREGGGGRCEAGSLCMHQREEIQKQMEALTSLIWEFAFDPRDWESFRRVDRAGRRFAETALSSSLHLLRFCPAPAARPGVARAFSRVRQLLPELLLDCAVSDFLNPSSFVARSQGSSAGPSSRGRGGAAVAPLDSGCGEWTVWLYDRAAPVSPRLLAPGAAAGLAARSAPSLAQALAGAVETLEVGGEWVEYAEGTFLAWGSSARQGEGLGAVDREAERAGSVEKDAGAGDHATVNLHPRASREASSSPACASTGSLARAGAASFCFSPLPQVSPRHFAQAREAFLRAYRQRLVSALRSQSLAGAGHRAARQSLPGRLFAAAAGSISSSSSSPPCVEPIGSTCGGWRACASLQSPRGRSPADAPAAVACKAAAAEAAATRRVFELQKSRAPAFLADETHPFLFDIVWARPRESDGGGCGGPAPQAPRAQAVTPRWTAKLSPSDSPRVSSRQPAPGVPALSRASPSATCASPVSLASPASFSAAPPHSFSSSRRVGGGVVVIYRAPFDVAAALSHSRLWGFLFAAFARGLDAAVECLRVYDAAGLPVSWNGYLSSPCPRWAPSPLSSLALPRAPPSPFPFLSAPALSPRADSPPASSEGAFISALSVLPSFWLGSRAASRCGGGGLAPVWRVRPLRGRLQPSGEAGKTVRDVLLQQLIEEGAFCYLRRRGYTTEGLYVRAAPPSLAAPPWSRPEPGAPEGASPGCRQRLRHAGWIAQAGGLRSPRERSGFGGGGGLQAFDGGCEGRGWRRAREVPCERGLREPREESRAWVRGRESWVGYAEEERDSLWNWDGEDTRRGAAANVQEKWIHVPPFRLSLTPRASSAGAPPACIFAYEQALDEERRCREDEQKPWRRGRAHSASLWPPPPVSLLRRRELCASRAMDCAQCRGAAVEETGPSRGLGLGAPGEATSQGEDKCPLAPTSAPDAALLLSRDAFSPGYFHSPLVVEEGEESLRGTGRGIPQEPAGEADGAFPALHVSPPASLSSSVFSFVLSPAAQGQAAPSQLSTLSRLSPTPGEDPECPPGLLSLSVPVAAGFEAATRASAGSGRQRARPSSPWGASGAVSSPAATARPRTPPSVYAPTATSLALLPGAACRSRPRQSSGAFSAECRMAPRRRVERGRTSSRLPAAAFLSPASPSLPHHGARARGAGEETGRVTRRPRRTSSGWSINVMRESDERAGEAAARAGRRERRSTWLFGTPSELDPRRQRRLTATAPLRRPRHGRRSESSDWGSAPCDENEESQDAQTVESEGRDAAEDPPEAAKRGCGKAGEGFPPCLREADTRSYAGMNSYSGQFSFSVSPTLSLNRGCQMPAATSASPSPSCLSARVPAFSSPAAASASAAFSPSPPPAGSPPRPRWRDTGPRPSPLARCDEEELRGETCAAGLAPVAKNEEYTGEQAQPVEGDRAPHASRPGSLPLSPFSACLSPVGDTENGADGSAGAEGQEAKRRRRNSGLSPLLRRLSLQGGEGGQMGRVAATRFTGEEVQGLKDGNRGGQDRPEEEGAEGADARGAPQTPLFSSSAAFALSSSSSSLSTRTSMRSVRTFSSHHLCSAAARLKKHFALLSPDEATRSQSTRYLSASSLSISLPSTAPSPRPPASPLLQSSSFWCSPVSSPPSSLPSRASPPPPPSSASSGSPLSQGGRSTSASRASHGEPRPPSASPRPSAAPSPVALGASSPPGGSPPLSRRRQGQVRRATAEDFRAAQRRQPRTPQSARGCQQQLARSRRAHAGVESQSAGGKEREGGRGLMAGAEAEKKRQGGARTPPPAARAKARCEATPPRLRQPVNEQKRRRADREENSEEKGTKTRRTEAGTGQPKRLLGDARGGAASRRVSHSSRVNLSKR
ncbi:hypothetical protein BESB_064770 [Besnoitia besnoiti]|uniref:Uncharacterized protein n=1 Tax=Besnoitia besnoiti TaxID=94643 RepID=A0A2A9MES3_BESBE|nr:hypothetical protein BESB_064770 [Besnoitia besnoiti]PFH34446.1 hypothetical protein BESB_064770 [Besnoitia besnoiti]